MIKTVLDSLLIRRAMTTVRNKIVKDIISPSEKGIIERRERENIFSKK